MIGDASIVISNNDLALHRDNDDDNQIIDEDKSSNNDEIFDEIHTTTMPTSPNGVTHRMEQHEG
jgi:hypothetical protein